MADRPLVEGEICATMDLRRSVILAVGCDVKEVRNKNKPQELISEEDVGRCGGGKRRALEL